MKLKFEHLAPYLPYGINAEITKRTYPSWVGIRKLTLENYFTYKSKKNTIKPILRPLSDLTKDIEHNGDKFVPIDWFEIGDDENYSLEYDNGNIKLIRSLESLSKNGFVNDINYLPFGVIQKLIEWHFDFAGLIEQKLAIDINTLNK